MARKIGHFGKQINWTIHVKNKVLHILKDERNILHIVKRRKANWIFHILHRNCLLKHITEGKVKKKDRSDGKMKKRV
jgi:hypothetical protein